mgnify:FL=1
MPQQHKDTASLQAMVDAESKEVKERLWRFPLPFKLKVAHASSTAEACDDILGYLQDHPEYNQQKFYFCSDTYPPTKDGLKSLKDALILAAHDAGLKIASSVGTKPKQGLHLVLRCSCSLLYQNRGSSQGDEI